MGQIPVDTYAEEVRRLIETRLRLKARTLDRALSKAGRLLPKWAHRDGAYLADAQRYLNHPKLRLMIDEAKAEQAYKALISYLETIDPKERRKTRILGTLGVVSFNLILVVAALIGFLVWRGYL